MKREVGGDGGIFESTFCTRAMWHNAVSTVLCTGMPANIKSKGAPKPFTRDNSVRIIPTKRQGRGKGGGGGGDLSRVRRKDCVTEESSKRLQC